MPSPHRHRRRLQRSLRSQRRRLLAEPLEDRRLLAVTFEFNYINGNGIGFNDPIEGSTYRTALESAAARLGDSLLHDATIEMDVFSKPYDGSNIAGATSHSPAAPAEGGFVHRIIPAKILGQPDANGAVSDGLIEVYFFGAADVLQFVTDPAEADEMNEIDFQAVILHELVHAIGFTSATTISGSDDNGNGISSAGTWTPFDQYLSDVDGNRLIDGDPQSATAFRMDASAWATHSVGGKGPDAGLFFDGPLAKKVYGGRVPLYSPSIYSLVSTASHLDSEGYPDEPSVFTPETHLMSHGIIHGAVPQELTLLEKAILGDIGIDVREDVLPVVTAPANIVVEGNTEGGFLGINQKIFAFLNGATATDLLDPAPTLTNNKPPFLPLGRNTITFTATDASGNSQGATSVITVVDTTPPTISVSPTSVTFEATGPDGVTGVTLPFQATVSDLVSPPPVVTFDPGADFQLGTTTATFRVSDRSNNVSTFDVDIIVQDTIAPDFTLPDDITIDSNLLSGADLSNAELVDLINANSVDAVDTELSISASLEFFPIGTTAVTFTVTDDSGNARMATTSLTVNDATHVVTTLEDELDLDPGSNLADLSLREAIKLANDDPGQDNIRFDPNMVGAVQLDTTLGSLKISDPLGLYGLGRDVTTINTDVATFVSRMFDVTADAGDVRIDGLTITGGVVFADNNNTGAGIRSRTIGTLTVSDARVTGNRTFNDAAAGAGIESQGGSLVLIDTIISNNQTNGVFAGGGGVWFSGSELTVINSTVTGNSTLGELSQGGGLYVLDSPTTITSSTISGNSTAETRSGGGGLALVSNETTIRDSTISGNSTTGSESPGGGIRTLLSPLKVIGSTISGNTAATDGGGVFGDRGDLQVLHSTITGNQAGGNGGGLGFPASGLPLSLTVRNSIVAANTNSGSSPDLFGNGALDSDSTVRFSLIGDNSGTSFAEARQPDPVTGNIVGTSTEPIDPLLGILDANGGPTQTHLLLEGSPAIDTGDPNFDPNEFSPPLTSDQRADGFLRIQKQRIDMGSIEFIGEVEINWPSPDPIVQSTPLTTVQLNATGNVPGEFSYQPPPGTILDAGPDQTLMATFTPNDLDRFQVTTATVTIDVEVQQDFGDAPPSYPVLIADDGARHLPGTLTLGNAFDLDVDGNPSVLADGDGADDDGVAPLADIVAVVGTTTTASFFVEASEAGKIDAWIDFDGDGSWQDPAERIFNSVNVVAGNNALAFNVPAGAAPGNTAARFRISTDGGLSTTGQAADGEVEDYLVTILDGDGNADASVHAFDGQLDLSVESNQIVARYGATVLFSAPRVSLGSFAVVGSDVGDNVSIDVGTGFAIPTGGLQLGGGAGENTLVVSGDGGSLELVGTALTAADFQNLDLSSVDANTVSLDATTVAALSPTNKVLSVKIGDKDRLDVTDAVDWRMTDPIIDGSDFILTATNNAGGGEVIQADAFRPWHNFLQPSDINNSGDVTAGDALRIINELEARDFSDRNTEDLVNPLNVAVWPGDYFDQNGDGDLTALDALRVINELALLSNNQNSAEGEVAAPLLRQDETGETTEREPAPDVVEQPSRPGKFDAGASPQTEAVVPVEALHRQTDSKREEEIRAVDEILSGEWPLW